MITRQESKQIVDFVIREITRRQFAYVTDGRLDLGLPTGGFYGSGQLANTRFSTYPRFVPHFEQPFDIVGRFPVVNYRVNGVEWRPLDYVDGGGFIMSYESTRPSTRSEIDGGTFVDTIELLDGGAF